IDLVEVERIERALLKGDRFMRRLYTASEIAYCTRHKEPARHFAARFAAKEAGMKALGTGWSNGVAWKDFEVRLDPRGRPLLTITGRAAEMARAMGTTHSVVSLAHDGGMATAVVIFEGEANPAAENWLTGRAAIDLPQSEEMIAELIDQTPGIKAAPETGASEPVGGIDPEAGAGPRP
ncbi:MAG: holo-ACP synthase, partial [Candidatus Eisenbacteria bacterium]